MQPCFIVCQVHDHSCMIAAATHTVTTCAIVNAIYVFTVITCSHARLPLIAVCVIANAVAMIVAGYFNHYCCTCQGCCYSSGCFVCKSSTEYLQCCTQKVNIQYDN